MFQGVSKAFHEFQELMELLLFVGGISFSVWPEELCSINASA